MPESALAQIFGAVSDRASVQGGKVIDIGEVFIRALAGEDTAMREQEFEETTGSSVAELVEAVRESVRATGIGDPDRNVNAMFFDRLPSKPLRLGEASGREARVRNLDERRAEQWQHAVLHEVAHVLVPDDRGHGEGWRTVYLDAVRRAFGDERAESEAEFVAGKYDE